MAKGKSSRGGKMPKINTLNVKSKTAKANLTQTTSQAQSDNPYGGAAGDPTTRKFSKMPKKGY